MKTENVVSIIIATIIGGIIGAGIGAYYEFVDGYPLCAQLKTIPGETDTFGGNYIILKTGGGNTFFKETSPGNFVPLDDVEREVKLNLINQLKGHENEQDN